MSAGPSASRAFAFSIFTDAHTQSFVLASAPPHAHDRPAGSVSGSVSVSAASAFCHLLRVAAHTCHPLPAPRIVPVPLSIATRPVPQYQHLRLLLCSTLRPRILPNSYCLHSTNKHTAPEPTAFPWNPTDEAAPASVLVLPAHEPVQYPPSISISLGQTRSQRDDRTLRPQVSACTHACPVLTSTTRLFLSFFVLPVACWRPPRPGWHKQ